MHQLIALAPALIFLAALWFMDTFRLVRPSSIAVALLYGAAAALGCEALHAWLMPASGLDSQSFSRYVAPLTEETVKAIFVIVLIGRGTHWVPRRCRRRSASPSVRASPSSRT